MKFSSILAMGLLCVNSLYAQKSPENWFNLNSKEAPGIGTERAYQELLKGKTARKVIVAVIDSGVEPDHEDLKSVMWSNPGEVAGNGKDDDGNGYVDDVHGWNFIGSAKGNVKEDNLEITRLYRKYKKKEELKGKFTKEETAEWAKVKKDFEEKIEESSQQYEFYQGLTTKILAAVDGIKKKFGVSTLDLETIKKVADDDKEFGEQKGMLMNIFKNSTEEELREELKGAVGHFEAEVKYQYNLDFDPRGTVGDNYDDTKQKNYGSNEYEGPDAFHGTHVAGIIAADRNNNKGIKGVCNDCLIMTIRAVPDGDERDKDVANAIRYAVDNGAQVVNMSFGKAFSWDKKVVDEAVKYAEKKGVLLVHAAGNDALNKDVDKNFPNRNYKNNPAKQSKTFMEIGAQSWKPEGAASFSNYGKTTVDIFSPGVDIYSTTPDGKYGYASGTSMAAPVAAGAAGLLLSYFPDLTALQVKEILMASSKKTSTDFVKPGTKDTKIKLSELCITGGTVDIYEAIKLAEKTKGKRKNAARP